MSGRGGRSGIGNRSTSQYERRQFITPLMAACDPSPRRCSGCCGRMRGWFSSLGFADVACKWKRIAFFVLLAIVLHMAYMFVHAWFDYELYDDWVYANEKETISICKRYPHKMADCATKYRPMIDQPYIAVVVAAVLRDMEKHSMDITNFVLGWCLTLLSWFFVVWIVRTLTRTMAPWRRWWSENKLMNLQWMRAQTDAQIASLSGGDASSSNGALHPFRFSPTHERFMKERHSSSSTWKPPRFETPHDGTSDLPPAMSLPTSAAAAAAAATAASSLATASSDTFGDPPLDDQLAGPELKERYYGESATTTLSQAQHQESIASILRQGIGTARTIGSRQSLTRNTRSPSSSSVSSA